MFFGRRGAHERRRALALRWPWIYALGFEGRPTPHPHLAVRNAALGGAAFSVAGLAVEASRASRDGRDRLEWALTRRTAVTRGGYPGQPVGWPRELHQHLRIRLLDGVVVAIVKIRGHEGAVPFCDVDVTLCDVDGGGVDV